LITFDKAVKPCTRKCLSAALNKGKTSCAFSAFNPSKVHNECINKIGSSNFFKFFFNKGIAVNSFLSIIICCALSLIQPFLLFNKSTNPTGSVGKVLACAILFLGTTL